MTISLDDTDRSLIRLLRLDGRRPNSELAAEVGLSASACLRRRGPVAFPVEVCYNTVSR